MKKFVSRTSATKRGVPRVGTVIQIPCWLSWVAIKAMLFPSGDQRGWLAFHPDGRSGRAVERNVSQLRLCSGCRLVGGPENERSATRTIHKLLVVSLPSTVASE